MIGSPDDPEWMKQADREIFGTPALPPPDPPKPKNRGGRPRKYPPVSALAEEAAMEKRIGRPSSQGKISEEVAAAKVLPQDDDEPSMDWTKCLMRVMREEPGTTRQPKNKLEAVARQIVDLALSGNIRCIERIADTVGGKPGKSGVKPSDGDGNENSPLDELLSQEHIDLLNQTAAGIMAGENPDEPELTETEPIL